MRRRLSLTAALVLLLSLLCACAAQHAQEMDENGYEDDMTNSYYGCLSVTVMDLMWRMSLLDHFMGTGCGADGMREAIMFFDMDRLDAPAIGAFV